MKRFEPEEQVERIRQLRQDAMILAAKIQDFQQDVQMNPATRGKAFYFGELNQAVSQANILPNILRSAERGIGT